jgi:predicted phage terminase large subunit-like protein
MTLNLDPAAALGALENMRREKLAKSRARDNFRDFIPGAWRVIEPSKPLVKAWHIDAIADHLQALADGDIQNFLGTVSPGSAKSNLFSVMFPAWRWLKRPGWRSTFSSYDSGLSSRDSVRCRDLIKSEWYQKSFEPKWTFSTVQDEKTYYVNSEKGFRVSTSVSGKGTGWRGNFVGVDDPSKADDQFSPAALEAVIRWWENTMYNRLIDMATDQRGIIMQRLSDRDLAAHVLRQGGWTHLMIQMEYDPTRSKVTTLSAGSEWRDPRREKGELMCPSIFPQSVVDDLKKNPNYFSAQYQQMPTPEGGGILKAYKFNYWKPRGMDLPPVRVKGADGSVEERAAVDLPEKFDMELQSWDMAVKDLKTSDFVVGFVIAVRGANRYIRDQTRGRMALPATITAVREMTARYPNTHTKLVEDKANGTPVIQTLQDEIAGFIPVNPGDGKIARASAASVSIESGNWYIPHPMVAAWVGDPSDPTSKDGFLNEVATFPFGKNDDAVDSMTQAEIYLQKQTGTTGAFGATESEIRVEPFDLKLLEIEKWPRAYGLSITWHEVAAIWIARQPLTTQHYLYAEYSAQAGDPSQHATEIKKLGDWPGYMTAEETGRDARGGYALATKYNQLGLKVETLPANDDAFLADFTEALRTGKIKVFGNLSRFFDQFRSFSRKDGKLPVYNRGLIDAAFVAWKCRDRLRKPTEPAKPSPLAYQQKSVGTNWMGK